MSALPARRPIRLVTWPDWSARNPYQALFHRALEPHGVHLVEGVPAEPRAVLDHRPAIDVFHLHWPYAYWRSRGRSTLRQSRAVLRFWRLLAALRSGGVRVVWTVHDVEHLEGDRFADRAGNRILHARADLAIHHTAWSVAAAARRFGPPGGDVLVMPHGTYAGAYPPPRPRAGTLGRHGIAGERRVLLCFGKIRPYKGFDVAVRAMSHLPAGRYHLVVAGEASSHEPVVRAAAEGREDVTFVLGALAPDAVADLMNAADCVLLPYARITGSGVLSLALTHGRGVVASDLPPLRETLADAPAAAVFVGGADPARLAEGVEAFFSAPPGSREAAARAAAEAIAWERLVGPVADWMRRASASR